MPLISVLERQREADLLCVRIQPGVHSELQDSQSYTMRPHLGKKKILNKKVDSARLLMAMSFIAK